MNELLTGDKLLRRLKKNFNYVLNTSCLLIYRSGQILHRQQGPKIVANSNPKNLKERSGVAWVLCVLGKRKKKYRVGEGRGGERGEILLELV